MKVAYFMVAAYITSCVRVGTFPCKYFQLNSKYFSDDLGIYSKLDIDRIIPRRWRLEQFLDDGKRVPGRFPVFFKPEWGQNAKGVLRADCAAELEAIRAAANRERIRYVIQEGAPETREFEIFTIRDHRDSQRYAELTITEARNTREPNPVNSIYNDDTEYVEITEDFTPEQRDILWAHVREIGDFAISRVSARANSVEDLLAGELHVIEINLWAPMPIHMLDAHYNWKDTWHFVKKYMWQLALLTRDRDRSLPTRAVFTKTWFYNRRNPVINAIRARL